MLLQMTKLPSFFWPKNYCIHIYLHISINNLYTRRKPKNPKFIYKKLYSYSYMFKIQSPPKYSTFDAIHQLRCFFHCSKQVLSLSILMAFSASTVLCFTSSHEQNISFWGRLSLENQKIVDQRDRMNRKGGAWGHAIFGQKPLNIQCGVGRCACK